MKYLSLIFTNLGRKKIRTSLTFMSVLVAFILFGLLGAVQTALSQGVDVAGADRLVVRHKVSIIQMLPYSYGNRMAQMDGIDLATHFVWFGGIYQDPKNFFPQMPVDPIPFLDMYPEYELSQDHRDAWLNTRTGAIVGRKLADRFGWKIGDRIPIQATIWTKKDGGRTWEFDIVGIYDSKKKGVDLTQFFFRYDYFDETRRGAEGQVGWYVVRVKNPDQAADVAKNIDDMFANSPYETKAETEGAFVQAFAKQIGNITSIIIAIMSAVFFTILLVAANTMGQSVRERIVELGVLKAIGFTDRSVWAMVLGEAIMLTATAGLIGLGLSWLAVSGMSDSLSGVFPVFYLPVKTVLIGIALTVAVGLVAGSIPSFQAGQLRIADALRR
ncbi:MAG: ABC transporter permease [Acidobacteria bacterium]|nr:ABC transporter permease [Acidobacteriota bacterium]